MSDPMKYYNTKRKQNNRDKFYVGLRKIHIYVEDGGKKRYYELLCQKIGLENFECFDITENKKGVIKHYFNNKNEFINDSEKKYIFLLDKDFDDKCEHFNSKRLEGHTFNELRTHPNFVIWKKYCIENYLTDLDLVIKTSELLCCTEINKEDYEKNYLKLYSGVFHLTSYYFFNMYFDLNLEYKINRYFDYKNFKLKLDEEIKIKEILSKGFLQNRDSYIECKDKEYEVFFGELKERLDEKYDIHGKEFLEGILKLNKAILTNWKEAYTSDMVTLQLINNIDKCKELCAEIRGELGV